MPRDSKRLLLAALFVAAFIAGVIALAAVMQGLGL
jgi:hypothetical protein